MMRGWYKITIRSRTFYLHEGLNGTKRTAVYTATGKLLCRFGKPGSAIRPGTDKGNSYCARSAKIKIAPHWTKSPNWWSRLKWSCQGSRSVSKALYMGKAKKVKPPGWSV
ncbi:hypothetical protein [Phaeodactylibacter sp.]|uniref:hypothetical protein n=1 Tax=Phaeodactylibacter sp. TaxID=1940289 RepID=UPI0025D53512|nr:hypothetical protein [Phaeodactylibacter sp.]MCI4650873.1 hypothetical protein [Phaeodactylibacter sp.]MCI5089830.1 hypothetical protein [Phaeodactylibacter sp.]